MIALLLETSPWLITLEKTGFTVLMIRLENRVLFGFFAHFVSLPPFEDVNGASETMSNGHLPIPSLQLKTDRGQRETYLHALDKKTYTRRKMMVV